MTTDVRLDLGRREFLTRLGAAVAGTAAWPLRPRAQTATAPDVEIELKAAPTTVQLARGPETRVWSFSGRVVSGPTTALEVIPGSYVGPILRFRHGQRVRIRLLNELPESTTVHWHGLDVPEQSDGHPRLAIDTGQQYVYDFEVKNRAGTYWYHPHPHQRTASQVMHGLAGVVLVSDPVEEALRLPSGDDEILCVIQDRQLDADNQIVYNPGMNMMMGFVGDRIVVNGRRPEPLSLATRAYRVRLMNGSNARVYKLAWSTGQPMTVIGTDGGLLERPVKRPYVTLAPGERVDTILDLSTQSVGTRLMLRSLEFAGRAFEMQMGMAMGRGRGRGGTSGGGLPNGAPVDILPIVIDRREKASFVLPERLSTYDASWQPPASVPTRAIRIEFAMMQFSLNGRLFDMEEVAPDETVKAGSTYVWEFDNTGPAMMNMRLGHPMHLHGRQFRVLTREVEVARQPDWRTLNQGFVDDGWKDTVLVMPGEKVRVLVQFSKYPGLYLYHCHILEHEDMGMMRNYRIV